MENSFIKSGIIYFIGTIIVKGISFFTLPIFTRIMPTSDYGLYSLYSSTLSILVIFIGLQIQGSVNLAYKARTKKEFDSYVANITLFPLIGLIIGLLSLVLFPSLPKLLQVPSSLFGILLIIQAFFEVTIAIFTYEKIIKSQPKNHLLFSFCSVCLNVGLSIVFVLWLADNAYSGRVYGTLISSFMLSGYVFIRYIPRVDLSTLKDDWIYGLKLSIPLIFHVLSSQILNVADRFMIGHYKGDVEVALYSFSYNLGMIIQMIWLSINNAWVPWYFDNIENKALVKQYCKQYIIFFTVGVSLFLLVVPEMVLVMGGKKYAEGVLITPLIAAAYFFVFLYSFYSNYQFSQQKTKIIPIATTFAAIINIVLNTWIIPKFGVLGAAVSTLISYAVMFLLHYIISTYYLKCRDFPGYYVIISIAAVVVIMLLAYLLINQFIIRCMLVIIVLGFYGRYLYCLSKKTSI